MLAVVKEPHIEMCLNGNEKDVIAFVNALKQTYTIAIVVAPTEAKPETKEDDEEYVNIEETDWYREMSTPGHLLAGARLKHDLTQEQLAAKCGICAAVLSAYENGKRKISRRAAIRIARALGEDENTFYDRLTK